jgi:hypothetical protein
MSIDRLLKEGKKEFKDYRGFIDKFKLLPYGTDESKSFLAYSRRCKGPPVLPAYPYYSLTKSRHKCSVLFGQIFLPDIINRATM